MKLQNPLPQVNEQHEVANQTVQPLTDFLLRRKDVEKIAGISRASIYRLIKSGRFPAPVSLGTGSVRWRQSDVIAWQQSLTTTAGA